MKKVVKEGITLAYEDVDLNPCSPPILFVHGLGCDHTVFVPQAEFFSRGQHVISIDLRGHGKSDAPDQEYTMAAFADDLAWLCVELGLRKPAVVGHSMGGNVALEFASRHREIPASIVLIDSIILPQQAFRATLQRFAEALLGPDYRVGCQEALLSLCLAADDKPRKEQLIASLPKAPLQVLASVLTNLLADYDVAQAAALCRVPVAYIGAAIALADLNYFKSLIPHLVTAQTLGSGHFSPLFVPDQINAMLSTFLKGY
jgi:pimeloyl-ACP methyl ester carboxylesterase